MRTRTSGLRRYRGCLRRNLWMGHCVKCTHMICFTANLQNDALPNTSSLTVQQFHRPALLVGPLRHRPNLPSRGPGHRRARRGRAQQQPDAPPASAASCSRRVSPRRHLGHRQQRGRNPLCSVTLPPPPTSDPPAFALHQGQASRASPMRTTAGGNNSNSDPHHTTPPSLAAHHHSRSGKKYAAISASCGRISWIARRAGAAGQQCIKCRHAGYNGARTSCLSCLSGRVSSCPNCQVISFIVSHVRIMLGYATIAIRQWLAPAGV